MTDPAIEKALTFDEMFERDDRERRLYEMREDGIRDHRSGLAYAREQGLAQGLAQGKAEGKAEGEARGRAEAIARMAAAGLPIGQIATIMGMSADEVQKVLAGR